MRILFEYKGELTCSEAVCVNYDRNIFDTEKNPIEGILIYEMREIYAIPMTFTKANIILQELCEKGFTNVLESVGSELSTCWYNPDTERFE